MSQKREREIKYAMPKKREPKKREKKRIKIAHTSQNSKKERHDIGVHKTQKYSTHLHKS